MSQQLFSKSLDYEIPNLQSLTLKNYSGEVEIFHDAPSGRVSLHIQASKESVLEKVGINQTTTKLEIDIAKCETRRVSKFWIVGLQYVSQSNIHLTLHIPPDLDMELINGSGDIKVVGNSGTTKVQCGSGDIELEKIASGDITVTSGDVTVVSAQNIKVKCASGDVEISRAASVEAKVGSGDLVIGDLKGQGRIRLGSGDAKIHISEGGLDAAIASGDLDVTVPYGVAVWRDLKSRGGVKDRLESVGEPEPGASYITIKAVSVSGDLKLSNR